MSQNKMWSGQATLFLRMCTETETEENHKAGRTSSILKHLTRCTLQCSALDTLDKYTAAYSQECAKMVQRRKFRRCSDSPNTQPVTSWTLAECWRWGTASPSCLIYLRACLQTAPNIRNILVLPAFYICPNIYCFFIFSRQGALAVSYKFVNLHKMSQKVLTIFND